MDRNEKQFAIIELLKLEIEVYHYGNTKTELTTADFISIIDDAIARLENRDT